MKGATLYRHPLKQGYLLKQSDVLKQWHRRYFVLTKECLCYYRTEKESLEDAPKEVIFFNDMSLYIDELPDTQTKYCLRLVKRSLSPKITARTFSLCSFSEHERNEWLSQILQAKAIALVVDPTAWIGSQEASTEEMDFEFSSSGSRVTKITSAKDVLQKCRHRLSLITSSRDSLIRLIPEDSVNISRERKSITLNQEWRNSITVPSLTAAASG